MTATVVFRADASPAIGGGHVMRCLSLADALAEADWSCGFAVRSGTLETVPALARSRHQTRLLAHDDAGEPAELARRWPDGADWLIVDHYRRDAAFEQACRPWAKRVMAFDDLADRGHDCDLLLDQSLGRDERDYAGLAPAHCRLLLGPRYALLRPAFAALRDAALARRADDGGIRRILVSLGATDPNNVTAVVLEGIGRSAVEAEVDVVMGAAALHLAAVRAVAGRLPQTVRLHVDAPDMAELMVQSDLAVGAAGTTSWERCCLGLPSLLVVLADNQRAIADALVRAEAAARIGADRAGLAAADVAADVGAIAGDPARRRRIAMAAAKIVDGRGVQRVRGVLAP